MFKSGFEFSEEKIADVRYVVYGVIDKIKAWDKDEINFAYLLDTQFKTMSMCRHEDVRHDLHAKEIEALEYAVMALNVLENEHLPKGDKDRNDRSGKSEK